MLVYGFLNKKLFAHHFVEEAYAMAYVNTYNCLYTICWTDARFTVKELAHVLRYALLMKRLSSFGGD